MLLSWPIENISLCVNKLILSINLEKTNYNTFKKRKTPVCSDICIDNHIITKTMSMFRSIYIDENLNWKIDYKYD